MKSLGTCHKMPQFKGMQGGTHVLPNVPFQDAISGSASNMSTKPNTKSMQGHRSRATTGSKEYKG